METSPSHDARLFGRHEKPTASKRASLAANRARVVELKAQLLALEAELDLTQAQLDAYTYPVLSVPPEVIAQIFVYFLPPYPKRPPLEGNLSPFTLTQICQTWRTMACSTGELWRGLELIVRDNRAEHQLQLTELFLTRSGSRALSIRFRFNFYPGGVVRHSKSIELMARHSRRIEHLHLRTESLCNIHRQGPLPVLRSLTAHRSNRLSLDDTIAPCSLVAPLLRKVALREWDDRWTPILQFSQLTVLAVDEIGRTDALSVLNLAPNLIICRLSITYAHNLNIPTSPPATHRSLEILLLRTYHGADDSPDPSDLAGFCEDLTLPALQQFEVSEALLRPAPVEALQQLLSRSDCHPWRIRITDGDGRPDENAPEIFRSRIRERDMFDGDDSDTELDMQDIEDAEVDFEWGIQSGSDSDESSSDSSDSSDDEF